MGLSCSCTVPIKNPWILQPRVGQLSCILARLPSSPRLLGTALFPAVSLARLHPLSFLLWKVSHRQFIWLSFLVFYSRLLRCSLL